MHALRTLTFQEALDLVESQPESQQDDLLEIVRSRRLEQRRAALADRIAETRREYRRGKVRRSTIDDLMKDLAE
jgi:hypothetical protein